MVEKINTELVLRKMHLGLIERKLKSTNFQANCQEVGMSKKDHPALAGLPMYAGCGLDLGYKGFSTQLSYLTK